MESSADFDGAVFGEETITVEIVQESVETEPDDSNIIILQPMDSGEQDSHVVEESVESGSGTQFQHVVVTDEESGQLMQVPVSLPGSSSRNHAQYQQIMTLSDQVQQPADISQIVSFSDCDQVYEEGDIVSLSEDQIAQSGEVQIVSLSEQLQQPNDVQQIVTLTEDQVQQPNDVQQIVTLTEDQVQQPNDVQQIVTLTEEQVQQQGNIQQICDVQHIASLSEDQVQQSGEVHQIVSLPDDFITETEDGQQLVTISNDQIQHSGDVRQILSPTEIPQSRNVHQIVSISDHHQLVQSLQGVTSAQLSGNESNIIILQPIEDDSVVTTQGSEYVGNQVYVQAAETDTDCTNQQTTEISNIQYITSEESQNIEIPKQVESIENQTVVDNQVSDQPQYIQLQPVKAPAKTARSLIPTNIDSLKPIRLIQPLPEAQLPDSQSSNSVEPQIPEFPDSQADEDQDEDDFYEEMQDPSVRNEQVNLVDSTQITIKAEPRPHVIEVFKSYEAVLARISEIEIDTNSKFVREKKNSKIFGQEWIRRPVRNEREFAWCSKNNTAGGERERLSPEIEFDGIPFINVGYIRLDCSLGSQDARQAKKLAATERKRKIYASKKIGCPAKIYVSQVTKFPDYQIEEDCKRNRQSLLQQLTVDLKYDWENVAAESWYYCRFPSEEDHVGHPLRGEGAGLHLPMDYRVKDKVKEWTLQGISSCSQMKALINQYVTEQLFPGQLVPPGRRFFPKTKEICNVMYCAKVQQLPPQLDLERIEALMDTMSSVNPGDSIHLRPSYPNGHHFMFVYQSEWQKHLLTQYGKMLVFVEPIYQYAQYPLPIYCLVVRTNIGFTIAGMFSLKLITKPLLTEVFKMFKEWNPDWKPKHLRADFTDENISGILENFNDLTVLLTENYVEETWRKWIDRKDSGVGKDTESLIAMLKAVARAQSQTEFEVALEAFVNSPRYLSVVRLRRWFLAKWLPVCERWTDVYRDEALRLITHGNRGKERKADLVAYLCSCLDTMKEASLSKVLAYLVTVLMPELFQDYSRHNVQMLSQRAPREDIPEYLQGRPSEIINHIMDRSDPCAFDEGVNIQELGMGNFKVNTHDVDFTRPNCSCTDWQKHYLPCKHFCVIFNHMPGWGWHSLIESYRESPLFVADPFCVEASKKMQERAEVKFEAIEEEDLEAATEVDASTLDDDDLDDALSTLNDSQEAPHSDHEYDKSEKIDLAKKIQCQFQDLTKAVRERKDSAGLLRMINEKLNSVLNVLKSPSKSHPSPSRARDSSPRVSLMQSPSRMSEVSSEPSTPILYQIKTEKEDKAEKFVFQVKSEKDMIEDDDSDIYDPPPIFIPVNVKISAGPKKESSTTKISIPFNSPQIVRPSAGFIKSSAGESISVSSSENQPKLVMKSTKRRSTDHPTKIYVPFKSPKPHTLQTGFSMPVVHKAASTPIKKVDTDSPLKKTETQTILDTSSGIFSLVPKTPGTPTKSVTSNTRHPSSGVKSPSQTLETSSKSVTSSSETVESSSKLLASPLKTKEKSLLLSPQKSQDTPKQSGASIAKKQSSLTPKERGDAGEPTSLKTSMISGLESSPIVRLKRVSADDAIPTRRTNTLTKKRKANDPDFEPPGAKKKAAPTETTAKSRRELQTEAQPKSKRETQTKTPKSKLDSESTAKSKQESQSTPKTKRVLQSTPARGTGKKTSVVSTPTSTTPDTDNVRKSSRKSTSIYAGADRIKKPSGGRNVFESLMGK